MTKSNRAVSLSLPEPVDLVLSEMSDWPRCYRTARAVADRTLEGLDRYRAIAISDAQSRVEYVASDFFFAVGVQVGAAQAVDAGTAAIV